MSKTKAWPPRHRTVDPEDISGRMFLQALHEGHERVGKKTLRLAHALGLNSRSCANWLQGRYPTYRTMQEMYYKLLEIGQEAG